MNVGQILLYLFEFKSFSSFRKKHEKYLWLSVFFLRFLTERKKNVSSYFISALRD